MKEQEIKELQKKMESGARDSESESAEPIFYLAIAVLEIAYQMKRQVDLDKVKAGLASRMEEDGMAKHNDRESIPFKDKQIAES